MGPGHHRRGDARQPGHMDAVALVRAAGHDFAQENHVLAVLHHGDAVVFHAGKAAFQLAQLMIMGSEQGLRADFLFVQQVFHHGPRNGKAVEGAGAPADLVQDHQRTIGSAAENARRLAHFHHKGALTGRQVVAGADAGKDAVAQADVRLPGGHKAADVRHQGNERRLAHVGAFTGHVGAGDDEHPIVLGVQIDVIGHERRILHHPLHDGMPSLHDTDLAGLVDGGLHIAVFPGHLRQRKQRVGGLQGQRVLLDGPDFPGDLLPHLGKKLQFQCCGQLLGVEDLLFDLLQFRRGVALGIGQRLTAGVAQGHLIQIALGHFDIVPEHPVILDAQVLDAGLLPLGGFHVQHPLLAVGGSVPVLVQLGVVAGADIAALLQRQGRVWIDGLFQQLTQAVQRRHGVRQRVQGLGIHAFQQRLDRGDGVERAVQRQTVPGGQAVVADLAQKTLHIRHVFQLFAQLFRGHKVVLQGFHRVQTGLNAAAADHGVFHPRAQKPRAHGGAGLIQQPQKGALPFAAAQAFRQFQIAAGVPVQKHGLVALIQLQMGDMLQRVFLRFVQIAQQSPGGNGPAVLVLHAQRGQRGHAKVAEQLSFRAPLGKGALRQRGSGKAQIHQCVQLVQIVGDDLPGADALNFVHQLLFRVGQHVRHKLAGAHIRPRQRGSLAKEGDAEHIAVVFLVQHGGIHHRAGGNDADHVPLHQSLAQGRIGQLLADGHLVALFDQPGDIAAGGVVGNAAHGRAFAQAAAFARQHQLQLLGDQLSVLKKHLVKIAQPEKQDAVLMLLLDIQILLHHRGHAASHGFTRPFVPKQTECQTFQNPVGKPSEGRRPL